MLIKSVMTRTPVCCKPADTVDKVAKLMLDHDCGEIPVCDGPKLVGVITDRDITCRAVATGKDPADVQAGEIMTRHVFTVFETDAIDVALELMEDRLVRRLPVLGDDGKVVGIVSQADLMAKVPTLKVAQAMRTVSKRTRKATAAL